MRLEITKTAASRRNQVDFEKLKFGDIFSDHMLSMVFEAGKWSTPQITPFGEMSLLPSLCALHYGQIVFDGLKAFQTRDGQINVFRPQKHHERFNKSSQRLCIPEVSGEVFLQGLTELLKLDRSWIPQKRGDSLYIRPFIFAADNFLGVRASNSYRFLIITSPVGAYYATGMNPVNLITATEYVRAAKGGLGAAKTPANYAATLLASKQAKEKGFTQVLWLDACEKKYIEEVGMMNIFFLIGEELITPSLEGTILAGVTRDSVLQLAKDWGIKVSERKISIDEVLLASQQGTLKEVFGTGTAAVISPVGQMQHKDKSITINNGQTGALSQKLYDAITAIQYGEKEDKFGWRYMI